jgi:hypothetical protein
MAKIRCKKDFIMMLATSGAADPQLVEGLQVKDPMFYQANRLQAKIFS